MGLFEFAGALHFYVNKSSQNLSRSSLTILSTDNQRIKSKSFDNLKKFGSLPAAMTKMSAGMYAGSNAVTGSNWQTQKQIDEMADTMRASVGKPPELSFR